MIWVVGVVLILILLVVFFAWGMKWTIDTLFNALWPRKRRGSIPAEFPIPPAPAPAASKTRGVVKWYDVEKGYGFITVATGALTGKDVFVHYTGIQGAGYPVLNEGDKVLFDILYGAKGPQAVGVVVVVSGA